MFPVFLDTCVLLKPYLCDALLSVAEAGVYRPLWSPLVMGELERNLARRGLDEKQIRHRLDQMNEAFPDAMVQGFEALISEMTNDPKDRHVLAAAVRGSAEVLVTENLRHFAEEAVSAYNIKVVKQDAFLRRFLADEQDNPPWMQSWLVMLRDQTAQGRRFVRVRVVSMPLTDYGGTPRRSLTSMRHPPGLTKRLGDLRQR